MIKFSRSAALLLACIILTTLLLSACGQSNANNTDKQGEPASTVAPTSTESEPSPAAEPELRKVTDEMGHTLEIPLHPKRVLAPYLEDPLTVLGVKPVAQWANGKIVQEYLQDGLAGIPTVDFSTGGLVPEQALDYTPDLIVLTFSSWAEGGKYEAYSKIAPTYVLEDGMADWRKTLLTLGDLLGEKNKAEQAISEFDVQVATAKDTIQQAIEKQEVALLWPTGSNLFLLSAEDYAGRLLYGDLGIAEPALAHGESFQNISLEKLDAIGKDYIFMITQFNDQEAAELQDNPVWKNLLAVKEGRLHNISWNHWMNNGLIANKLNLADTLAALAP